MSASNSTVCRINNTITISIHEKWICEFHEGLAPNLLTYNINISAFRDYKYPEFSCIQILEEMGFTNTCLMKLLFDNQAAIHITSNPFFHERQKHIDKR